MPEIDNAWLAAMNRIAATNDNRVHKNVFNERDKGQDLVPEFVRSVRDAHDSSDIDHLTNYVTYLIWAKLAQFQNGEAEDRFLGIHDLREFLKQRYGIGEVDNFLASLEPVTPLGDLRRWLCAQPRTYQLYTHTELDLHLLQWDIEELRRSPPQRVLDDIKKAYRNKKERSAALEKWRQNNDSKIREYLDRGIPRLIQEWAFIIARQLVTGSCTCPARFYESDALKMAAEKRCRHSHFLSEPNLTAALAGDLPHQRRDIVNALEYVERAVIEKMHMILQKTFATTMLANVFVTPGNGTIRQMDWKGNTILTEAARDILVEQERFDEVGSEDARADRTCLGCAECHHFVGDPASVKGCAGHRLVYGTVSAETQGGYCEVMISQCQNNDWWFGNKSNVFCPACGQAAIQTRIKIEILLPENYKFADVVWADTFPSPRSEHEGEN